MEPQLMPNAPVDEDQPAFEDARRHARATPLRCLQRDDFAENTWIPAHDHDLFWRRAPDDDITENPQDPLR
jgi:hypothetical protein